MELPLANEAPLPGEEYVPGSAILAVDDSPANLAALEAALGDLGGGVAKARSGREALRLLLNRDFALILLDVKMPGFDGFETARIIRQRRRTQHVPIIFLTAFERNDRDVREAYALGAVDFLFKPLVPEILRAKVSVFVELQKRTFEVRSQGEKLREMERRQQESRIAEERRRWENERLREESKRKDEFLAMLAHELRNPLSPMVTGIELLKRPALPEEGRQRVCESMERQVHHLIRLVDDLLDISRISRGKIEIVHQPFDLTEAVGQAVDSVRFAIEERRQELLEELPDGPVLIRGDRSRVVQLVSNLLANANRYTSAGGRIELRLECEADEAVVVVADNGRGIRPEMLGRIFDMFVQERESGKGLGLGLTLVKRIVELHDGRVDVASDGIDQGATFTVRFPLLAGSSSGEALPAAGGDEIEQSVRPLVIAVIEDEDDVREATRCLLESWGHQVHTAADGSSGVALVCEVKPQAAVVDIGMPGLDGYEVARRIREEMGSTAPFLVAVTGYGQERDRRRASLAGFDVHLVKPATAERLREVLQEVDHGASEQADGS